MIVENADGLTLENLVVSLDHLLTGKDEIETARTAAQQRRHLNAEAFLTMNDAYYLSDGGYSRIKADEETGRLVLSGVSRQDVIQKWHDPAVQAVKLRIEALLRDFLQEAGVLVETEYTARRAGVMAWLDGLGDPVRLYREVVLPTGGNVNMDALGRHWTPDKERAIAPFGRGDYSTGERVIMSCLAPRSAIDDNMTISNMLRYGEYEVTLIPGTKIEVDGRGYGTV